MQILIGKEKKILKQTILKNTTCPNCKNNGTLELNVYGGTIKLLFIIPTLPLPKQNEIICKNCHKSFSLKQAGENIKQAVKYENQKKPIKTPIWNYLGIFLLIGILGAAIYIGIEMTKMEKEYIQQPLKGDVYRVSKDGVWTTLKVSEIRNDSVIVYLNDYSLNNYLGIEKIDIKENYTKLKSFSKLELQKLYNDDIIYQIDRN